MKEGLYESIIRKEKIEDVLDLRIGQTLYGVSPNVARLNEYKVEVIRIRIDKDGVWIGASNTNEGNLPLHRLFNTVDELKDRIFNSIPENKQH